MRTIALHNLITAATPGLAGYPQGSASASVRGNGDAGRGRVHSRE